MSKLLRHKDHEFHHPNTTIQLMPRYAAAESDCSVALALDDGYVKAYLRRGTARTKLGKLKEAREGLGIDCSLICVCTEGIL